PARMRPFGRGLREDLQRLQERELIAIDADSAIREPKVVLFELRANLRDEQDRVAVARVAELHERALGPRAALEVEPLAEHVEAFGRQLHQAVGPRQTAERNAGAVEVPTVQ